MELTDLCQKLENGIKYDSASVTSVIVKSKHIIIDKI